MFRYTVTENDYLKMAKWLLLKQRGPKKTAVPMLLLKTVGQMAVAAWLIFGFLDLPNWLKPLLGAGSLLWASLALFQYFFLDVRANMLLQNAKRDAAAKDFWREHQLKTENGQLILTYGEVKMELPCRNVTGLEEAEDMTLILRGHDVFDMVPPSVTKTEKWAAFTEQLFARKEEDTKTNQDLMQTALLEKSDFCAWADITQEEMARELVKAKRQSYRYACGWSWQKGFMLVFPIALGIYAAFSGGYATLFLCLVTFVLFNFRQLMVFTPAYQTMVQDKLHPPTEKGYLYAVRDETIWLVTAVRTVKYPIATLKKRVRTEDGGAYLYFARQVILYVPEQVADGLLRTVYGE